LQGLLKIAHGLFRLVVPFQGEAEEKVDFIPVRKNPGYFLEFVNGLSRVIHLGNQPTQMEKDPGLSGSVSEMGAGNNRINGRNP
jgi:hypothetical protein